MARLKNGILGPFIGSLSLVTGYLRLGIPVMRFKNPLKDKKNKKRRTPAQRAMNSKMAVVMNFLSPLTSFVNIGFSTSTKPGQTPHNIAVSRMLLSGIKGNYPNYELDYPNIQLTDGKLRMPENIVARLENDDIIVTWDIPSYENFIRSRDQIMAVCYDAKGSVTKLLSGARISDGIETLKTQASLRKKPMHVYISFISDDRKLIAKSFYAGMIK